MNILYLCVKHQKVPPYIGLKQTGLITFRGKEKNPKAQYSVHTPDPGINKSLKSNPHIVTTICAQNITHERSTGAMINKIYPAQRADELRCGDERRAAVQIPAAGFCYCAKGTRLQWTFSRSWLL